MAKKKFIGIDKTIKELNNQIMDIKGDTTSGLIEAGLFVKKEAVKQTPIDQGNLRGSAYVVSKRSISASGGFAGDDPAELQEDYSAVTQAAQEQAKKSDKKGEPVVLVGFSARYAPIVHELMTAVFKSPGTKAKFLEDAIKTNTIKILNMIKNRVSR